MRDDIKYIQTKNLIVGTGAAGLAAADYLHNMGETEVIVITEGLRCGTSRNTGSDKQTYYKLSQSGQEKDSVMMMAETLFGGGSMDGDIALVEAACSLRAFYHLVESGVDFPFNRYGEYVGYQTDHDECRRGSSIGPLTSRSMVECLEQNIKAKNIRILDHYLVVKLLTQEDNGERRAAGVLAVDISQSFQTEHCFLLIQSQNIIWATGGEAGMYKDSVYPIAQKGGMAPALWAGAAAKNLTESQYGLASVKFRWNLSGTYQQCIPRYISIDHKGEEHEFLNSHFDSPEQMVTATFLKGYQWPFDPGKIQNHGSSFIDILVYREKYQKNRRVFLDFTKNPSNIQVNGRLDHSTIKGAAREYLEKSDALLETPLERLRSMNPDAIRLYKDHNIDLSSEYLEISICAQHNNGGLSGDIWWQNNIKGFFPVGEVNGTHGVCRPGGSALNSGQVGALRAAQFISRHSCKPEEDPEEFYGKHEKEIQQAVSYGKRAVNRGTCYLNVQEQMEQIGRRMSEYASMIRTVEGILEAIRQNREQMEEIQQVSVHSSAEWKDLYRITGLLFSQRIYLESILDYIQKGGESRGSCLVIHPRGELDLDVLGLGWKYSLAKDISKKYIQEVLYDSSLGSCRMKWREVREIPQSNHWFEQVWCQYRKNEIF